MRSIVPILPSVFLLAIFVIDPALARDPTASAAAVRPVVDRYHGVAVTDPYRWLEDGTAPEVQAWSAAQNARSRAYLDHLPQRELLYRRILSLTVQGSPSYRDLVQSGGTLFALATQPPKQQPLVLAMGRDADPKHGHPVVDPNAIDPAGQTAIDWYVPSPDGRLVAASLSRNGSEDGTVHVFETATGRDTGESVPRAQYPTAGGSLAWKADSSGFWYTRYPGDDRPEADRHFFQQVFYHRLHADPAADIYVAGKDFPRIAEVALDSSQSPHAVMMSVANGDGGAFSQYVIDQASGQVARISTDADKVVAASVGPDDRVYLVSRQGAPHGRLLALSLSDALHQTAPLAHARLLVAEGDGVLEGGGEFGGKAVIVTPKALYLRELVGGPSRVNVFGHDGKPAGTMPLPAISAASELEPTGDGYLLVAVQSYLSPQRIVRFDEATATVADTSLDSTSPIDFSDAEVVRTFAVSKDGTRVPMNIIRKRGMKADGTNPTLLYGYGGYGVSEQPRFVGAQVRTWLDAGGVYVDTNLRGGGEYGEAWHAQGALTHKQNVFDDFLAAAHKLVADRITAPAHLAIVGGSNGGLLMGAALTQEPSEFRAVVSLVGIYDMMRIELDPNGAFNRTEFGSVTDPDQFKAMLAYSPYQAVRDGVRYPAVYMATGTHDGRVNPAQSRKMIARLQAATGSGRPVYLSISDKAGHGIGSALTVKIAQQADTEAFLFDQLGMKLPGTP